MIRAHVLCAPILLFSLWGYIGPEDNKRHCQFRSKMAPVSKSSARLPRGLVLYNQLLESDRSLGLPEDPQDSDSHFERTGEP